MMQAFRDQIAGAARLVRSGQLVEATTLLQRTLRGDPTPPFTAPEPEQSGVEASDGSGRGEARSAGGPFDLQAAFDGLGRFNPFRPAGTGSAQEGPPDPATPLADAFLSLQFDGPAGGRPYKLYVPSVSDGAALPLVVMLHGCTQSPDDFAAGTRMNLLAEERGFLVCYPGQTAAANSSRCWNWFNAGDQRRGHGEPAIIAGITRDVMARHAVDPQRVYVAGLSAGGALAATMGQAYPDLYAAVGVHSGLACGAAQDLGAAFRVMRQGSGMPPSVAGRTDQPPVPTIVFHGDRDTTVNPINGDEVRAQIVRSNALRTEVEDGQATAGRGYRRVRFVDGSGRIVVEQWSIHGAGHAWAGGSSSGSYTDPSGPDASREMLRFFAGHRGTTPG